MKMMKLNYFMALAVTAGFFVASCNNSEHSSTNTTTNVDSTAKKADTAKTAASAGKVVSGNNVEVHAVGNNMSEMHFDVSEIDAPANTNMKVTLIDDATDVSM